MITDVRVSVMYQGNDNQWRIDFIRDGEERSFEHIREIALVSMYHSLAKILNEKHGCSYTYSASERVRCYNALEYGYTEDGGSRNLEWVLESYWGRWTLIHRWKSGNTVMHTTYGDYYIDEIKVLVESLGEWLRENDIHQLSYENCKENWLRDLKYGVHIRVYVPYQHLFDADPDFSPERLKEYRREHCQRVWEHASENAVTLWNYPDNEVKVEITSKYVKFFRRDDVFSCYTYPALSELKNDIVFRREIIATLEESNQFDSDEWATWVDGTCDMPPFPISVIFNSEYQNYKFQVYE